MKELPELKPYRSRRQRRTEIAVAFFVALVAVIASLALPADGQTNPEQNDPAYWGADCYKIDEGTGSDEYIATADFRLVVLKSGNVNDEFYDVRQGDVLATVSGRDISHLILCTGDLPTTTTTVPETSTTTVPETSTTTVPETSTTTVPESTTTTEPERSTTTTQPERTTTTTVPESTTTTVPEPTTTVPEPTTTQPTEITETTITQEEPPSTLPFTGPGPVDFGLLGLSAFALVALGAAGLYSAREQ